MSSSSRHLRFIGSLWLILALGGADVSWADANSDAKAGLAAADRGDFEVAIQFYTKAIEDKTLPSGALAILFGDRGIAYHRTGRDDRAIEDYDRAIQLAPNDAHAFDNRGNAYFGMGEFDRAIQDYDRSIQLAPHSARAFDNRGSAYYCQGQIDDAIRDYDESIRIDASNADAFENRGNAYFLTGRLAEAEGDLRTASDLGPTRAYSVIRLYVASSRQKKDAREELIRRASKLDLAAWPGPIAEFYLRRISADTVLAAANASKDATTQRDRLCEADYYLGEGALLKDHAPEARQLLSAAVTTCDRSFVEFKNAGAELDRIRR
jgi:lipoprotein NlpI